jgi:hypothetical protein
MLDCGAVRLMNMGLPLIGRVGAYLPTEGGIIQPYETAISADYELPGGLPGGLNGLVRVHAGSARSLG